MSVFSATPVRYLITRGTLSPSNFQSEKNHLLETVSLAVEARIELVQIREKSLPGRQLFELAVEAAIAVRGSDTMLFINERFDIAVAAGADGVHLTSTSIPADRVRENVPAGFLIGVSCHDLSEVCRAKDGGADFALFGPVFRTPGKGEPIGLGELTDVCSSAAPFPVIAIGGIDVSNAGSVVESGAAGYAAIRYLNQFVRMAR